MELRQLRYFLVAVEKGSINRAAEVLKISQPSLSHSMKMLEQSVGAELLTRGGSGIRLTPIGEEFSKYARVIVREAEKALDEVNSMRGYGKGHISIGLMSGLASWVASTVCSRFLDEVKDVRLNIATSTYSPAQIAHHLRSAEWDLAVHLVSPNADVGALYPGITVERMKTISSHVYCNPRHPFARKGEVSVKELADAEWVTTRIAGVELSLREAFRSVAAEPRIRTRTDSLDLVCALVQEHAALCLLPATIAEAAVKAKHLVKVNQDALLTHSSIALLFLDITERTPALRHLMSLFRQECK